MKLAWWLTAAAATAFAQDPSQALLEARDRFLAEAARLPRSVCTETIDRTYYSRPDRPDTLPSCEQIAIDREKGRHRVKLDGTDRLRVAVAISPDREIYSWTGSAPFSYSVEDILHPGPIGTGAFAAHLVDLFRNPSVRFHLLAERPQTLEYGFHVPVEASHYSVLAGDRWLAAGFDGFLRIDRESRGVRFLNLETGELPAGDVDVPVP